MRAGLILLALACLGKSTIVQAEMLVHEFRLDSFQLIREVHRGEVSFSLPGYNPVKTPGQWALPERIVHLVFPGEGFPIDLLFDVLDVVPPKRVQLGEEPLAKGSQPKPLCPFFCPNLNSLFQPGFFEAGTSGTLRHLSTGRLGSFTILKFAHRPVEFDPLTNQLIFHSHQRLVIQKSSKKSFPVGPAGLHWSANVERLVDNPGVLKRVVLTMEEETPSLPGIAIVTTEAFVAQSRVLNDYLDSLRGRGFEPVVVTENDFEPDPSKRSEERVHLIREWLKTNLAEYNLRFALLIGNPDPRYGDIPMVATHPLKEFDWLATEVPTDAYFSDLTGNWDLDGDGMYGEFPDDSGPGGVDFYPELAVGRIPVYGNYEIADRILERSLLYQNSKGPSEWRRRILFPGAVLFFANQENVGDPHMEGGDVAEVMIPEWQHAGFDTKSLYEQTGYFVSMYRPNLPLTETTLIQEWNRGYGVVYWFGHGSEDAAFRTIWHSDKDNNQFPSWDELSSKPFIQSIDFDRLAYEKPALVFHGSCSNGTPENAGNIAYTQLRSGSVASYASTRVAFGSTGQNWQPSTNDVDIFMMGYFVVTLLREGKTTGEALSETRMQLSFGVPYWLEWHTKFATMLYGDPTLTLANCQTDADCDDENPCNGQERCQGSICVGGTSTDCSVLDDICNRGECHPQTGVCQQVPLDGTICDDKKFCTVGDRCDQGVCTGAPRTCTPEAGPCVLGQCQEDQQACVAIRLEDGTNCSFSEGQEGFCQAGVCYEKPKAQGCGCGSKHPGSGLLVFGLGWLILCSCRWLCWRYSDW